MRNTYPVNSVWVEKNTSLNSFSATTHRVKKSLMKASGEKAQRKTYLMRKEGCSISKGWVALEPRPKWRRAVLGIQTWLGRNGVPNWSSRETSSSTSGSTKELKFWCFREMEVLVWEGGCGINRRGDWQGQRKKQKLYCRKQVRLSVLDAKELLWEDTLIIKIQRKFLESFKVKYCESWKGNLNSKLFFWVKKIWGSGMSRAFYIVTQLVRGKAVATTLSSRISGGVEQS